MFRDALRRLLWLGPTLLVVTIPTFWAVTRSSDRLSAAPPSPLPLFFNPSPAGAREHAEAALFRIASSRSGTPTDAARELVRLGGAALPHVLPLFDSLPIEARVRVALALAPVARRMGIGGTAELESPEGAVLFWSRYWEEHSIDFRPAIVHRSVRRFAERPSPLRRTEVLELDTFALEDLIDAMRTPRTGADVVEARALCEVASHVTSLPLEIPPDAGVQEARDVVRKWRVYFLAHRGDYVAFTGTGRLGATLRETRYGHWLEQLQKGGLGRRLGGQSVSGTLWLRGPITLFLLLSALLGGYPLAVLAALARTLGYSAGLRRGPLVALTVVLTATPVGLAGLLLRGARATPSIGLAAIAMALACGALAMRHARSLHDRARELPHLRTRIAFGASRFQAALSAVRAFSPVLVALAASDLPALATVGFVIERAFSLPGLGEVTTEAVRSGDLGWLMAMAVLGTLTVGVAQIAADVALRFLDPRPLVRGRS